MLIFPLVLSACSNGSDTGTKPNPNTVPKSDPAPVPNPAPDPGSAFHEANQQLAQVLPDKLGFRWIYHGFAEYSHEMSLTKISPAADGGYSYSIQGEVGDPSGGEAKNRDFSLSITYQIKDGVLIQTKKEQAMMDSPFDRLELLKTPLVKGASWSQQVTNREGQSVELQTVIEDVKEENGAKIYRVLYRQPGSEYYEKREFKEGIGVLSFEKNWFNEGQWYPMGYQLYEEMSGYQ